MRKTRILSTLVVALMLLLIVVPVVSAQEPTSTPNTWTPPDLYKISDDLALNIGDSTTFTITVANPGGATWYNVRVIDVLDPAFQIDGCTTTMGTCTITGNTVIANGTITLPGGGSFVLSIDVTVVGPIPPGGIITNVASLEYTNEENTPQPTEEATREVEIEEEIPVVPEASTLLLLGSAATGLAGYVGLQIRARRGKKD